MIQEGTWCSSTVSYTVSYTVIDGRPINISMNINNNTVIDGRPININININNNSGEREEVRDPWVQ